MACGGGCHPPALCWAGDVLVEARRSSLWRELPSESGGDEAGTTACHNLGWARRTGPPAALQVLSVLANQKEACMAFIVAVILFVVVLGLLDGRLLPWPDPRSKED